MSTPCVIQFYEKHHNTTDQVLALYKHWDGYPSAIGKDIYNFLKNIRIGDGIGKNDHNMFHFANGFNDLVLQFVVRFKQGVGDLYATDFGDADEWNYDITYIRDRDKYNIIVWCRYDDSPIQFDGTLEDFGEWLEEVEKE